MANKKNKPNPKPSAPIEPKTEPVIEEPEIVDAEVYGVDSMLNIRKTPKVEEGNIVMQLKKGTKIQVVDPKKAKNEWYKIIVTDNKSKGFAMKKYIKII